MTALIRSAVAASVVVACVAVLRGEQPLNVDIPLTEPKAGLSSGSAASTLAAAREAQGLGLPTIAIGLYRELLAGAGADRAALTLPLATALLDAGRAADAEQALNAAPGPRGPEWRLRYGLAAAQQKKFDVAADQVRQINVDQLTRPDRAWFWFLQATLSDVTKDGRDYYFYNLAQNEAPSDTARATILAAGLRMRLTVVPYTAAQVDGAHRAYEQDLERGRPGYGAAETYAIYLYGIGRRSEAVKFLADEVLPRVPRSEKKPTDLLRRLLGMIGERTRGGRGRNALNQLLETGEDPNFQRQALELLAQDSQDEPERGLFRAELDKLLAGSRKSEIYDSLLLVRANLALKDSPKDYGTAERCANQLKDDFPGSPLRPHAFVVLATSAWEQHRYRVAADNARQAREALAASPAATSRTEARVIAEAVGELRVLEAEARFRARDYGLAVDAYAAALREPPAGISPGDLMFQEALSAIRANQGDPKADLVKIVDQLEADKRFDSTNRWEAEWSLARGLKVQGKTDAALQRVTRLLDSPEAKDVPVSPELRARMSWLQSRLSFDANQFELTLRLVSKLAGLVTGLKPELRTEIESNAALLQGEAQFKLGQEKQAEETLVKLRKDFPKTEAAIYSFLVTAQYYAEPGHDQIQQAQTALQQLIDAPEYQDSPYVPYALFQQALLSERLGRDQDANDRIEQLVQKASAPADLVFAARLKQGDLLRTLNQFPLAQRAYEDLVNNPKYAQRRDVVVAQLRLAECHNAQSSTDPSGSHADQAQSLFEELLYRVSAPADVRVEAGYNLGKMLERRGQYEKARDVWWRDVVDSFLVRSKPGEMTGATEPYWLARTLLDLGALFEQRDNLDEARRIYVLLRDSRLGYGEDLAVERLQRLGIQPAALTTKP